MLTRLVNSALEKLAAIDISGSTTPKASIPVLSFPLPPPAEHGTRSLCARCLTALSHVIAQYGDATSFGQRDIPHSSSLSYLVEPKADDPSLRRHLQSPAYAVAESIPSFCVICTKTLALFNAARNHIAFEPTLRNSSKLDWSLGWRISPINAEVARLLSFPHDSAAVSISITHRGGYGWGIGGFKVYPDWDADTLENSGRNLNSGDFPVIIPLDPEDGTTEEETAWQAELDFSSTLGTASQSMFTSWAQDCSTNHVKCHRVYGNDGLGRRTTPWFPDRLVRITRVGGTYVTESGYRRPNIRARIVSKSNALDFPPEKVSLGIDYLSLSHCWGPSPEPSAPLGGRTGVVLSEWTLPVWQVDLPISDLPLTFRHAMMVCAALEFEYMWIDSLCILQDSRQDWQAQSAVMGDVYKHAWLNVAALSSISDYEGFINENRDARVEFGFRAPFASILGRSPGDKNDDGQVIVLLHGQARLLWDYSQNLPGTNASNAPLFTRAWVFQERSLARRTLAFARNSIYWSCDECSKGEQPGWGVAGLEHAGVRWTLDSMLEAMASMVTADNFEDEGPPPDQLLSLRRAFDLRWFMCVTTYTSCRLTVQKDKLMAISSIARELANTNVLGKKKYLAGLWDVNLASQLAWTTVKGRTTPPKKRCGMEDYAAPSWSWASVEASIKPQLIFNSGSGHVRLVDIRAADVALETDFAYGFVKAGWIRIWGGLRKVKAAGLKNTSSYDDGSAYLTDDATGADLWFCPDTTEGYDLVKSKRGLKELYWMPLILRFSTNTIACTALVLLEIPPEEAIVNTLVSGAKAFIKPGERVFRRLGTGDFGLLPSLLKQDPLLMSLGKYPDIHIVDGCGGDLAKGFRRRRDGFVEVVLV